MERNNKNININISNNNIINIFNENSLDKNNTTDNLALNDSNNKVPLNFRNKNNIENNKILSTEKYCLPEIENTNDKRLSQNISPKINPKDCMTFFGGGDKKESLSKEKKTILNDSIKQQADLFIEANKEREFKLKKSINNNNLLNNICIGESQLEEENEDSEENIEDNGNIISLKKEQEESEINCDCLDILIVDDEQFNIMASQKMVQKLGFESDIAFNGEECINLIKNKKKLNCLCNKSYYKLIFLDIVMPILDGIKTAKKIQEMIDKKEINNKIKIIFVSGNIDENGLKESLLKIDCVKDCLQKPVRIEKYQKIFEKYYKD